MIFRATLLTYCFKMSSLMFIRGEFQVITEFVVYFSDKQIKVDLSIQYSGISYIMFICCLPNMKLCAEPQKRRHKFFIHKVNFLFCLWLHFHTRGGISLERQNIICPLIVSISTTNFLRNNEVTKNRKHSEALYLTLF